MSFTSVPTVVTGQTWTAANQNLYLRDNFDVVNVLNRIVFRSKDGQFPVSQGGFEETINNADNTIKFSQRQWPDSGITSNTWVAWMPNTYAGGTLTVDVYYYMDGANVSKGGVVIAQMAAMSDGDSGVTTKSLDADNTNTQNVPDAADKLDVSTITITNDDSIAAGDLFFFSVGRLASDVGDTAVGDMNFLMAILKWPLT